MGVAWFSPLSGGSGHVPPSVLVLVKSLYVGYRGLLGAGTLVCVLCQMEGRAVNLQGPVSLGPPELSQGRYTVPDG